MNDPRTTLSEDNPMREGPLYVKGDQTWSLEEGQYELARCRVHAGNEDFENLWVAVSPDGKEMAFLNNALNFLPARSWGAVFPKADSLDAAPIRGEEPQDLTLTLHPTAWDASVEHGHIDERGLFLEWLELE